VSPRSSVRMLLSNSDVYSVDSTQLDTQLTSRYSFRTSVTTAGSERFLVSTDTYCSDRLLSVINNCCVSFSENNDGKTPIAISKELEHTESIDLVSDTTCLIIYMQAC